MKFYAIIIMLFVLSCQNKHEKQITPKNENTTPINTSDTSKTQTESNPKEIIKLEEYFVDSLNIGRPKLNKVEVLKYRTPDSVYVNIKFYCKKEDKWELEQMIHFLKDGVLGCDAKISDFNNDNLNDLTIVSAVAARGANEVRRLFIYNMLTNKLVQIKNSERYPNMRYNKELDCVDAFLVYGGSSTVFLRLSSDSLIEFASVELFDGLTVRTSDNNGNEKIIFQDSTFVGEYIRFSNFNPLTESKMY